jgi:hypothetical protein
MDGPEARPPTVLHATSTDGTRIAQERMGAGTALVVVTGAT